MQRGEAGGGVSRRTDAELQQGIETHCSTCGPRKLQQSAPCSAHLLRVDGSAGAPPHACARLSMKGPRRTFKPRE
jgi:hypothetical protein